MHKEVLRAEVCPTCGYSLAGHGTDGICPECGQHYDRNSIVLYGWGCGRHATLSNCSTETLLGNGLISVAVLIIAFLYSPTIGLILLAAGVLVSAVTWLNRQQTAQHPGPVQVWLEVRGCGQQDRPADPSLWGLISTAIGWISIVFIGALMVQRWAASETGCTPIVILAACVAHQALGSLRRWMNRARITSSGCMLTPWKKVREASIVEDRKGRYRLQIRGASMWLFEHEPVDAEVAFDQRQAEELRRRVDAWRAAAKIA